MKSKTVTNRICRCLRELWDNGSGYKLEDVVRWSEKYGHRLSRQTVSRVLNQKVKRLSEETAATLAGFIQGETQNRVTVRSLLDPDNQQVLLRDALSTETWPPGSRPEIPQSALLHHWLEALQARLGELAQALREGNAQQICICQERIADIYVLYVNEPDIAQGHYAAALRWATSPDPQCRLLCRLAFINQSTSWFGDYLQEAQNRLPSCIDPALKGWVDCLLAVQAQRNLDFSRAEQLAERALEYDTLPLDIEFAAHGILLAVAGVRRDVRRIRHLEGLLPKDVGESYTTISRRYSLLVAYFEAGKMDECIGILRELEEIYARLNQTQLLAGTLQRQGFCELIRGNIVPAREVLHRALARQPHDLFSYFYLCKTWLYDQDPEGLDWARALVEEVGANIFAGIHKGTSHDPQSPPGYPVGKLAHRLGVAERIYRAAGVHHEFRDQVLVWQARLAERFSHLEMQWLFTEPLQREEIEPVRKFGKAWTFDPGSVRGRIHQRKGIWIQAPTPLGGVDKYTTPRYSRLVAGDFVLQVTTHGGEEVIADLCTPGRLGAKQRRRRQGLGAGGLHVLVDGVLTFRMVVHIQSPGEVLCEIYHQGVPRTLGRGVLEDGPVRLRLERTNDMLFAYASNDPGPWFLAGRSTFPTLPVTVGFHGQALVDRYMVTNGWKVRFGEVRLSTGHPR